VSLSVCAADIYAMPFPSDRFDFAWCAQSLISLSEPHENPAGPGVGNALREIHRVLRTGGQIGLLEQDAMHYLLLPWPPELELAIQQAQRQGFARMHGHPQQLHIGRRLGKLLAESGFQPWRRITLSSDRQGLPDRDLQRFLQAYLAELRDRVHRDLSRPELRQFDRLTDPESENSFLHDPHFEMTWLEFVFLGMKL
jgi:SAM-dependent methyltransferase